MALNWNSIAAIDPGPLLTVAQASMREFAKWIDASSSDRISPTGHDTMTFGPWASITPTALDDLPETEFGANALPLYVPMIQTRFVTLPTVVDRLGDALGHTRPLDRVNHLDFMAGDGRFRYALVGLESSTEPFGAALDRLVPGIDLDATLVLAIPLWIFTFNEKGNLSYLPRVPR